MQLELSLHVARGSNHEDPSFLAYHNMNKAQLWGLLECHHWDWVRGGPAGQRSRSRQRATREEITQKDPEFMSNVGLWDGPLGSGYRPAPDLA
jgi:hypothetical protein